MPYNHGVKVSEVPTSLLPPVESSAGIPVIVGTAPVNMTDASNVNKPVLCGTYEEAVAAFGFVPAKESAAGGLKKFEYTISEFIKSQFGLFAVGPAIIINVLDPKTHKVTATTTSVTLDTKTGSATIDETGILPDSVTLTPVSGSAYSKDTDYIVAFDVDGKLVITSKTTESGEFACTTGTALTFAADKVDPTKVTADEIIGGVDTEGNKTGLELVNECFPRFRLAPGLILAPGFSGDSGVAATMAAKCANINEHFKCKCIIDVPTDTVKTYADVPAWKNNNNVADASQIVCWPGQKLGGVFYHMSTQLAGLIGKTDSENDDVPYVSPSNHNFQMDAAVLADGTDVYFGPEIGAYLNSQGVVTALNMIGGWKCWGNRTAVYPSNTDVKDSFIPVSRMFAWVANTLVQTFWSKVDAPLNRRQIDTVVDSANVWLNGLVARQYLLGARVEFLDSENPTVDLMDGIARFHIYMTPPSPNREIDFILEYNPAYLENLF